MENLAAVRDAFLKRHAAQNNSEFLVYAGLDLRPLGRNGLRSSRGHGPCRSIGADRTISRADRFSCHHACFFRDHSRMSGDALARRKTRAARRSGILFRADGGLHRAHLRKSLLPRSPGSALVFRLPFLSWLRRREFRRLHPLAPGTISNRMPRQRFRIFNFGGPLCRLPSRVLVAPRSPFSSAQAFSAMDRSESLWR